MKDRLYCLFLRLEIFAHEVDVYLAKAGGNYELAADSVMRKIRAQRELDLMGLK